MTASSHSYAHGPGTGAGIGSTAARDEAAVLAASAHLTDRDRELTRLVARHRVLTTDQLAALRFANLTTARHRLAVLVRLGVLRRFRPRVTSGSAPWHYVLGPIGAALLGQEDRDGARWTPEVCADRQLALERSQRLGHMTGASWFFVAGTAFPRARRRGTAPVVGRARDRRVPLRRPARRPQARTRTAWACGLRAAGTSPF